MTRFSPILIDRVPVNIHRRIDFQNDGKSGVFCNEEIYYQ